MGRGFQIDRDSPAFVFAERVELARCILRDVEDIRKAV
jgi:hypothetical protein